MLQGAHIDDTVVPESGLGFTEEIDHSSTPAEKEMGPGSDDENSDESMAQLLQGGKRGKADMMEDEPAASSPEEAKMIAKMHHPSTSTLTEASARRSNPCTIGKQCLYEITWHYATKCNTLEDMEMVEQIPLDSKYVSPLAYCLFDYASGRYKIMASPHMMFNDGHVAWLLQGAEIT